MVTPGASQRNSLLCVNTWRERLCQGCLKAALSRVGLEGGAGRGAAACVERLQLCAAALETWLLQVPWVNANLNPTLCLHCKPNTVSQTVIPVVQGHRASGWWEWNWYPGQPGRLLMGLHSSRAPRRTYTSQHKRTIHEGVRPGDSLLICSAGHALGG